MKIVAIPLIFAYCCIFFSGYAQVGANKASDTLSTTYSSSQCGLNYVSSSVTLGKKMIYNGLPFPGVDQPASLTISGIPVGASIEVAYAWWDITGKDTVGSMTVQNPDAMVSTFTGVRIGGTSGIQECWGIGASAFRADITSVISGNGTYMISGLPTDSIASDSTVDVNGLTLFIIYADATAGYIGNIVINDGFYLAKFGTVTQSIENLSLADTSDLATAFMLISDMQNESGSAVKMNNGSYQGIVEEFWDFEERSTLVLPSQTSSQFGLQVPNDCSNFIMIGLYYQYNIGNTVPIIIVDVDSLSSSIGSAYQWSFNGASITGATNQSYTALQPGVYSVSVGYGQGCSFTSDTVFVPCIPGFIPSIFNNGAIMWTADSVNATFQWFNNGTLISGANNAEYTAADSGAYWIELTDSLGCVSYSDSLFIDSVTAISDVGNSSRFLTIYPNPSSRDLNVHFRCNDCGDILLEIVSLKGELLLRKNYLESVDAEITLPKLSGIYFVRLIYKSGVITRKVVFF